MESLSKKLQPGVYQGAPNSSAEPMSANPPRVIRTMKNDTEETIKNQKETLVSIAIAEEKKRARLQAEAQEKGAPAPEQAPSQKRISRLIIVFIVLVAVVALRLAYVFVLPKFGNFTLPNISLSLPSFLNKPTSTEFATSTASTTPALARSLIPTQNEMQFSIIKQARVQIANEIMNERAKSDAPNAIKNFYFTEESASGPIAISANRLIIFSGVAAPEMLTRALEKPYMAGIYTDTTGTSTPFIILKTSDEELGIAGMLEWEQNLPAFFDALFGTRIQEGLTASVKFHSVVISGKDARVISSPRGEVIAYTFANQATIIITSSQSALKDLVPLVLAPTSR